MPLSVTEIRLLEEACANRENQVALGLLNVFAATTATEILTQIADAPVTIRAEFMQHVRKAIDEQRRVRPRR